MTSACCCGVGRTLPMATRKTRTRIGGSSMRRSCRPRSSEASPSRSSLSPGHSNRPPRPRSSSPAPARARPPQLATTARIPRRMPGVLAGGSPLLAPWRWWPVASPGLPRHRVRPLRLHRATSSERSTQTRRTLASCPDADRSPHQHQLVEEDADPSLPHRPRRVHSTLD